MEPVDVLGSHPAIAKKDRELAEQRLHRIEVHQRLEALGALDGQEVESYEAAVAEALHAGAEMPVRPVLRLSPTVASAIGTDDPNTGRRKFSESQGEVHIDDLQFERRRWSGKQAYSDSKLWDVVLACSVARRWPETLSSTVDPGWIKTRMGGPGAADDLPEGADTPVWLATSDDPGATVTGRYSSAVMNCKPTPLPMRLMCRSVFYRPPHS
ncbi:MAG TPA: hypothetical protein VK390_01675 [Propionibacteriaceae bacterium]|nr:hypothetical protein [Propionibacteriaceae bacterium]